MTLSSNKLEINSAPGTGGGVNNLAPNGAEQHNESLQAAPGTAEALKNSGFYLPVSVPAFHGFGARNCTLQGHERRGLGYESS